jgi:hypothetical protein
MAQKPEPYLTHARPARWSGWTLAATLVLLAIYYVGGKDPTWERPLFFFLGLMFFVAGIDALRTREAMFDWGFWIHWRADRSERPVLFWILTSLNFALGIRVIWLALFADGL